MIQKFYRNRNKFVNEDIVEIIFYVVEDKIYIFYYTEDVRIVVLIREFFKFLNWDEKGVVFIFNLEMYQIFQVGRELDDIVR